MKKVSMLITITFLAFLFSGAALAASDDRLPGQWEWRSDEGDGFFERHIFTFRSDGSVRIDRFLPGMTEEHKTVVWEVDGTTLRLGDEIFQHKMEDGKFVLSSDEWSEDFVMEMRRIDAAPVSADAPRHMSILPPRPVSVSSEDKGAGKNTPQFPQNMQAPQDYQYPGTPDMTQYPSQEQQMPYDPYAQSQQTPQLPPMPQYPQTQQFPTPPGQYPQTSQYPGMPGQSMPYPQQGGVSLDGVWVCNMNGQQLMMQISNNQYQMSANGMVTGMGMIEAQGNMVIDRMANGQAAQYMFQMNPDGRAFTITAQNGISLTYQRIQ